MEKFLRKRDLSTLTDFSFASIKIFTSMHVGALDTFHKPEKTQNVLCALKTIYFSVINLKRIKIGKKSGLVAPFHYFYFFIHVYLSTNVKCNKSGKKWAIKRELYGIIVKMPKNVLPFY